MDERLEEQIEGIEIVMGDIKEHIRGLLAHTLRRLDGYANNMCADDFDYVTRDFHETYKRWCDRLEELEERLAILEYIRTGERKK